MSRSTDDQCVAGSLLRSVLVSAFPAWNLHTAGTKNSTIVPIRGTLYSEKGKKASRAVLSFEAECSHGEEYVYIRFVPYHVNLTQYAK